MLIDRRGILVGTAIGLVSYFSVTKTGAQPFANIPPHPDPRQFQSGDFLWPKPPGEFIPYSTGTGMSREEEREMWLRERDAYVSKATASTDPATRASAERVRNMTFEDFHSLYTESLPAAAPREYSYGTIGFGHVGILEVDDGGKHRVIEAMPSTYKAALAPVSNGVIESLYTDWIAARSGENVWHGRIADRAPEERKLISLEARKYLGRSYNFWNLDLSDSSEFYCSKLCCVSISNALRIPIDGNGNTKRDFWFSPRQLLKLDNIIKLHSPGPY
jgi:hypothetical protein